MKTLGLIGGTSWHSTIDYYRLINEGVSEKIGSQFNPQLILYSLNIRIMRELDRDRINEKYLEVARTLQQAGAEGLMICANTPHMVFPFLQPNIDIPVLHIADAVGEEAAKKGLTKLGLLGNKPTMTGGFIPERLEEQYGIETIIPEGMAIGRSHYFISKELTQGTFSEDARSFYKEQIKRLNDRGASGVILGCTELPLLLNSTDSEAPLLSTTDLHAKMAVDFILS